MAANHKEEGPMSTTIPTSAKLAITARDATDDPRDIYEATITVRIHADDRTNACESLALLLADAEPIAELYDVRAENYCWHADEMHRWHAGHRKGCELCR